jgi:hypothetical protein
MKNKCKLFSVEIKFIKQNEIKKHSWKDCKKNQDILDRLATKLVFTKVCTTETNKASRSDSVQHKSRDSTGQKWPKSLSAYDSDYYYYFFI